MVPAVSEFYRSARNLIELRLLQALKSCPNDAQSRIAKRAGIAFTVAHVYLHKLNLAGLVDFCGPSDKKRLYLVTESGQRYLEELEGHHFGLLMEFVEEAGHQVSLALEQARSDGFDCLGVLGDEGALPIATGIARALGIDLVPIGGEEPAQKHHGRGRKHSPMAVLVVANPSRPDIALAMARLEAAGVRCYLAATAGVKEDSVPAGARPTGSSKATHWMPSVRIGAVRGSS